MEQDAQSSEVSSKDTNLKIHSQESLHSVPILSSQIFVTRESEQDGTLSPESSKQDSGIPGPKHMEQGIALLQEAMNVYMTERFSSSLSLSSYTSEAVIQMSNRIKSYRQSDELYSMEPHFTLIRLYERQMTYNQAFILYRLLSERIRKILMMPDVCCSSLHQQEKDAYPETGNIQAFETLRDVEKNFSDEVAELLKQYGSYLPAKTFEQSSCVHGRVEQPLYISTLHLDTNADASVLTYLHTVSNSLKNKSRNMSRQSDFKTLDVVSRIEHTNDFPVNSVLTFDYRILENGIHKKVIHLIG